MNVKELLNKRNNYLEWVVPWQGMDIMGIDTNVPVIMRATVEDCINYQRKRIKNHSSNNEEELLLDFIAINWATIVV